MKRFVILVAMLALSGTAFASQSPANECGNHGNNCNTGNGGNGGDPGSTVNNGGNGIGVGVGIGIGVGVASADASATAVNSTEVRNTNTNFNSNTVRNDVTNVQGQQQGQLQGQFQTATGGEATASVGDTTATGGNATATGGNVESGAVNVTIQDGALRGSPVALSTNYQEVRQAPSIGQGSFAISGCSVGGNAGGSNVHGSMFLGFGWTPSQCYDFMLAQAYQSIGEKKAVCDILRNTKAGKRQEKRGVVLPECLPEVVAVPVVPAPAPAPEKVYIEVPAAKISE